MKLLNKIKRGLIVATAATLVACGGSGTCVGSNGTIGDLSLNLTAPNQFPAGVPVTAYLTMTNTSTVNANNLFYAIPDATNYTGTAITVNNASNPCKNILSGKSCTFSVQITNIPTSHPGSFTVTATPNSSNSSSVLSSIKSAVGLKADTLSLTANIGLTNVPANTQSGANGITFLYANTVAANSNGATLVSIVAYINSATAGTFNTINLTDSSQNVLTNATPVSGNSGNGLSPLTQGQLVSFVLSIPAGVTSYTFYGQTMQNGSVVDNGSNANVINLATASQGVLTVKPTNFALSAVTGYESQVLTYTNIGNGVVDSLSIADPTNPVVKVSTTCGSSLQPGASCIYIVKSNAGVSAAGSGSIQATYSTTGQSSVSAISNYTYQGANPQGGLSVTSGDNPTFTFTTDSITGTESSQITLTNLGNVNESNIVLAPSQYFRVAASTNPSTSCVISGNNVSTILTPANPTCTLTLIYNNSSIMTDAASGSLGVTYTYNGQTGTTTQPLAYQTLQAAALLQVTAPTGIESSVYTYNYGSIIANYTDYKQQIFTVTNVGTDQATNVNVGTLVQGPVAESFTIINTGNPDDCKTIGTIAKGSNCKLTVNYGPISSIRAGNSSGHVNISYTSYTGSSSSSLPMNFLGTAIPPLSANILITNVALSPAATSGNGESTASSFQVAIDPAPEQITLTYQNLGESAAQNLELNFDQLQAPYSLTTNNCDGKTLQINDMCTVVLSLDRNAAVGQANLLVTNILMAFTDQRGNIRGIPSMWIPVAGGVEQGTIYVNIYPNTAPVVFSTNPADGATNVSSSSNISITFDQPMDTSTLVAANFNVAKQGGGNITLVLPSYSEDRKTVTFSTTAPLEANVLYDITVPGYANVKDALGRAMTAAPATSAFTVGNWQAQCDAPGKARAVVLNYGNSSITTCAYNTDGGLSNCSGANNPISGLNQPTTLAAKGSYFYVPNIGSSVLTALQVDVNPYPLTQLDTSGGSVGFTSPTGTAAFNSTQISVNGNGTLTVCYIGSDPIYENTPNASPVACTESTPLGLSPQAYGIFYGRGYFGDRVAYISNTQANTVSLCTMSGDNYISSCQDSGAIGLKQPVSVLTDMNSAKVLITNKGNSTVATCDYIPDSSSPDFGKISNCTETGSGFNQPNNIYLARGRFAYITNQGDNSVSVCGYSGGTLSNCNKMPYGFNQPSGIYVNTTCGID